MNTGLVLVDIQNDYFPGGSMELVAMGEAADRAAEILQDFRRQKRSVYHMQHVSTRPGATSGAPA